METNKQTDIMWRTLPSPGQKEILNSTENHKSNTRLKAYSYWRICTIITFRVTVALFCETQTSYWLTPNIKGYWGVIVHTRLERLFWHFLCFFVFFFLSWSVSLSVLCSQQPSWPAGRHEEKKPEFTYFQWEEYSPAETGQSLIMFCVLLWKIPKWSLTEK